MKTFASLLLIGSIAMPLRAQIHFETGGGAAHLDQLPSTSLTSLGGGLDAFVGRGHLEFSGIANDHLGLGVTGSMYAAMHFQFTPGGWLIAAGPVAEMGRGIGEHWASTAAAELSVERRIGAFAIRGGWREGVARNNLQSTSWYRPTISAERQIGAFNLGVAWERTTLADNRFHLVSPTRLDQSDSSSRGNALDIHDVTGQAAWHRGALQISARAGRRWGTNIAPQLWWESRAALRIAPLVSLTFRTGKLAADALLALRGGEYTTFGLKVDMPQRKRDTATGKNFATAMTQVVRENSRSVHLYFTLPPLTRQATVMSDLTGWHKENLARTDDGRWEIVLNAPAGVYRINVSVDSGPWLIPAGLPATEDGFGSKAGLMVVEK